MRYFITGATGFIGSHVARQLRQSGHDVVALVRNPDKASSLVDLGVELSEGDVTDRDTLRDPMRGVDGVFHLAAWYEVGTDSSRAEQINVEGTRNVLEVMKELGIRKGVYTSTLAVNSDTGGRRVDESYRFEGEHLSVYDETKWRAHHEVAEPMIEDGLPLVIVMPGVVYGRGDTSQMGELMADAMAGKLVMLPGPPTGVCWAHVDDVAHAHLLAMEMGEVGESYIISGPCHSFKEGFEIATDAVGRKLRAIWVPPGVLKGLASVAGALEKVLPMPAEYTAEALRVTSGTTYFGDNTKARRKLGYRPRTLEQGMRDTYTG